MRRVVLVEDERLGAIGVYYTPFFAVFATFWPRLAHWHVQSGYAKSRRIQRMAAAADTQEPPRPEVLQLISWGTTAIHLRPAR